MLLAERIRAIDAHCGGEKLLAFLFPDFLDRALIVEFLSIKPEIRRDEAQFWREFSERRPRILVALLDATVAGLRNLPHVKLERPPRLADFARWVSACEETLGMEPGGRQSQPVGPIAPKPATSRGRPPRSTSRWPHWPAKVLPGLSRSVEAGDDLDLSFDEGRIVLVPAKRFAREGWADAAKRIAEAGDDALIWPEFGNAGDTDLKW